MNPALRVLAPSLLAVGSALLAFGCLSPHEIRAVAVAEPTFPAGGNSITYIGHATVLIRLETLRILTDPMFSDSIGGIAKRHVEPGISLEKLPPLHAILISHEHPDHLDRASLEQLPKDVPVILPKGLGRRVRALGFMDVRELNWWDRTTIQYGTITATPARHLFSRVASYVIEGSRTAFFAGDTGLFDGLRDIGRSFQIDLAVLPIGDYRPRLWFIPGFSTLTRKRHMAPEDLPAALDMLRAKIAVPIHWGTFKISGTALHEPIEDLQQVMAAAGLEGRVVILQHGERLAF